MSDIEAVEFECGACEAVNHLPFQKILDLKNAPLCGGCNESLFRHLDKNYDHLAPETYIHPLDEESLAALKRIPGVTTMLRSLIRHSFELATRLHHQANFVRVGPKQLPEIWSSFVYAGEVLGIAEETLPELYVYQDPVPNAYTFGVENNFVAISTGCLNLLDKDEILFVLGHELGHVHADHVLFKSAARVFGSVASTVIQATMGLGSLVVYPIQIALLRWDRASELSCDRAALLVVKNPSIALRTLMKLSGGTDKLSKELDIDAFIEQADEFGDMQDEGPLGRYLTVLQTLFRSHPYPIWRAKELLEWVGSGNFLEVLDGDYVKSVDKNTSCTDCGSPLREDAIICPQCGASQPGAGVDVDDDLENEDGNAPVDPIGKTFKDIQGWYKRNFTDEDNS
jgi:Zn-dependent protease with chaperone function